MLPHPPQQPDIHPNNSRIFLALGLKTVELGNDFVGIAEPRARVSIYFNGRSIISISNGIENKQIAVWKERVCARTSCAVGTCVICGRREGS